MLINHSTSALSQLLSTAYKQGYIKGQLKFNESMSHYTTWRVGGTAECLYQPVSVEDLQALLQCIPQNTPIYWLGLGSNLLVRDGGIKGLVINTKMTLNDFSIDCDQHQCLIKAYAGVTCAIFSRNAANEGVYGAEFLSGIPGTIGGALAMNAGAFGGETWTHVQSVEMINHQGEVYCRTPNEFSINYRQVQNKYNNKINNTAEWFLSASFLFERNRDKLEQSKQAIKKLLMQRAKTQPTKQANAGSVFKNPDGDYAARLIESSGLKKLAINDAQVSEKHANFIINKGQAQASDIEALIEKVQAIVLAKHKVKLVTEVHIIGEQ
jgi:UDP-N-acetylmuramate dehydrogenase